MMWKKDKQSISSGDGSTNLLAGRDINLFYEGNIPTKLIDQKIDEDVRKLRKSRFFHEFDTTRSSSVLGRRLTQGELSGGSDELRRWGVAWCARLLSRSEELDQAEKFLELARALGDSPETKIAEAFILSQKVGKSAALQALAGIDSDASRSACLMIVVHHDGAEGGLQWMNCAGYTSNDLDSDGKSSLLLVQLQLAHWDAAAQSVGALRGTDFEDTPTLHHLAALTKLIAAVPTEFRADVLTQVPFEAADFRLASDAVAMDARRAAHSHFLDAVEAATGLVCLRAARTFDDYALWLELKDSEQAAYGKKRLEAKLRDPNTALGVVHFALQFGIKLDLDAVERDIDRHIAINGGMTMDAALARLALVFTKPTHEEAANYIARHYDQLILHINSKSIQSFQIEMFSRAGLIDKANEVLDQLVEQGISPEEERDLRRIITEVEGNDPVESRIAQYKKTGALSDLINLVAELEQHKHWYELCEYGKRLFDETGSIKDAERLVNAFNNTHRSEALVEFLNANAYLLSQSKNLKMSYAWGLYHKGAFLESRTALAELRDDSGDPNYHALQVNLSIAMGDLASLSSYVASEFQNRDNRSAHDLMLTAQVALRLGSSHARDLVFEAAAKACDDATILTAAYFVATSAGWEGDPQVYQWLERAAELSGDDGPLQRMSLKDILDQKSEWDRRESETWRLLAEGQIPIFLAAQSLNRTLIDLTTFPALANFSESDPRRRSVIPTYSGKRVPLEFDVNGKTVALDATALLTLSYLKILDKTLDAFETVYIPHSTLGWLLDEQQKAAFHQPSRIQDAHQVRDLLATDALEKFVLSTVANSDLSAQVGDELAALIAEAEKVRECGDTQHIVVRSAPVHRLSSLMEEEADLSAHVTVLSSCLAVVRKLRQKGQITAEEEKRARSYLQLHEKPWPNQPEIVDGATLYLDDLAIKNFLHLGLLGKLKNAGLRAVVSPREVSEVNALISYEHTSDEVKDIIERIRASLNSRIESGHVRVSGISNLDGFEDKLIPEHPTFGTIALAPHCDAVIVDDRFVNKHANIGNDGRTATVLSTLDLLDALVAAGVISDDDRLEYRTRLRRAGYFFVSVNLDELDQCLRGSEVFDGNVVETAELKAIRESVLRVRMSDWLQLPDEAPWLDGTLKAFIRVLRNLWEDGADIEEVTARSNWLAEQIDVRGWSHSLIPENADNVIRIGRGVYILLLLTPPTGVQQSIVDAYLNWVEERILAPIKGQFPDLYDWLVEWHRSHIAEMVETELLEGGQLVTNIPFARSVMAQAALKLIHPLIRKSLLSERTFRKDYGVKTDATIAFGASDVSVQQSELFDAVRSVLTRADKAEVSDGGGRVWTLRNEAAEDGLPNLVLSSADQRLVLPDFAVLSEDPSIRTRSMEEAVSDVNLPLNAREKWRNILTERALEDNEVDNFHRDIRDTPVNMEQSIRGEIKAGEFSISSLVPNSRRYFERLVGVYDGSTSIRNYAAGVGRKLYEQLAEWRPYEGFLFSLLLSSHSALTAEICVDHLDNKKLVQAYDFIEKHGDMLSRIGAFEVGIRILPERPEVAPFLLRLVHLIRDDDVEGNGSEFKLLSALFILVDGELSRTRLMAEEPSFYRRLASLAQAALIHRQLVQSDIDFDEFCQWAFNNCGEHYYMQSLADMRTEPRWTPDLAAASQMKDDYFGRIMIASSTFEKNNGVDELRDTVFGDGPQSLSELVEFPRPFFPGPLEGAEDSPNALPDDLARIIEEQLNTDVIEASSFVAIVNSAMIFRITSGHTELAAKALRFANYRLANLEDKSQLVGILNGLSTVAAVSRNSALADELRILVRRYRRDSQFGFSIEEAMRMCLVASAARADLLEWREFAGEWLTELAFGELEGNEGKVLHSHLIALLHSVPELWLSCARADAALQAWRFR